MKSLAGLETKELITREVDKSDRRKMITRLTTRAKRLKKKLIPFVVDVNERALKGISRKDVDTARRVLAQTYLNLTED